MFQRILCAVFVILVIQKSECAGPMEMSKSFIAWGEITKPIKDMDGAEMQVAFEETFDVDNQNSAFAVWVAGKTVTFVTNHKTNQTFRYTEGTDCELTDEKEWIRSEYPPGLLGYEDDDGNIKFSLRQLFNIPEKFLVWDKKGVPAVYRGVPAKLWVYEIAGRDEKDTKKKLYIYEYWSDGTWGTSSNEKIVPLGFIISKTYWSMKVSIEETSVSVFGFVTETYDRKFFEPFQGVFCPNRTETLKFPSVQMIRAISVHSEMILPDYQEIRYIDTYFDPRSQLLRIDVERIRGKNPKEELKTKRYESEIAIGNLGVVFRQSVFKDGFSCDVIPFDEYENDVQNFLDVKNLAKWKVGKLFGLNETKYVYTGKTVKRDIPCHVFQGVRTDWPEASANVTSLWEWCFNVNMSKDNEIVMFLDEDIGLISAQVTILSSDLPKQFAPNYRMFHHFYEVMEENPAEMDATKFDISRCFGDEARRALQFYVDYEVTGDNKHVAENLTSDISFLQKWKSALYQNSGLSSYTLRIAKVKSTIIEKKLYIQFLILDNKNLPRDVWIEQKSAFEAEKTLRDNVHNEVVSVTHPTENGPVTFKAVKGSVSQQINPDFNHDKLTTTTTSTSSPPTTLNPFSLRTEPEKHSKSTQPDEVITSTKPSKGTDSIDETTFTKDDVSDGSSTFTTTSTGTTGTPPPKEKQKIFKKTGHQPGTVAAVSISMLLIGITIGSGGMFYKNYGFSCLKK